MSEGRIVVSRDGSIGRIVFDNEARRNAITIAMGAQLREALADLAKDADVNLVVLTGAGEKSFVSGADISEFDKRAATSGAQATTSVYEDLRHFPKPTMAAIHGYCFGGGVALALACDLRFAADDALFSIPPARLGIAYRADFTRWLIEAVGAANAKEMLITARRYDAREALRIGLVHRVVLKQDFDAALAAYCADIAANAPLSTSAAKIIVNETAGGLANADLALCQRLVDECRAGEDFAEGRRAFAEKRKPVFRGR